MKNFNNQSGRSMIEMLGVLAIIGVLSVGGISGYSKAMTKFKTNKTLDQIAMTLTNIRTLYAQQVMYDGLSTSNAYDMGVVDDAMVVSTAAGSNTLKNPFANAAGSFLLGTAKSGQAGEGTTAGTDDRAFLIVVTGLPREACVTIATNDWGSGYSSGFLGIAASGTAYDVDGAKTALAGCEVTPGTTNQAGLACNGGGPLTVANAASGCACGTSNSCSVALKYY